MQLHRPKSLDDLNVDFFSGDVHLDEEDLGPAELSAEEESSNEAVTDFDAYTESVLNGTDIADIISEHKMPQLPQKDPSEPYSREDIMNFLAEDFSKLDDILNDVTFTQVKEEEETNEKTEETEMNDINAPVDEKELFESFPDLSSSIIDKDARPTPVRDDRQSEKDAIKKAKENAKTSIENEKKKIKEQKKLEKTVQKPFGKRRAAIFFLILFLIIGILASSCIALIYAVDKADYGLLKLGGTTIAYVDGENIGSEKYVGSYLFVRQGRIQGNDTLLFIDDANTMKVADVIAFGDGVYAVNMNSSVYRAEQSKILGYAEIKTPDISAVRNIIVDYSAVVFAALALYFVLVILFSAIRIRKLNSAIRQIEESYELV
ncbi:MAG: hypothetical protein ACI4GA_07345 [Acutalibacteraceae bacterium]|nr:hypothetical protein [Oscillospiraceae bacterium]